MEKEKGAGALCACSRNLNFIKQMKIVFLLPEIPPFTAATATELSAVF